MTNLIEKYLRARLGVVSDLSEGRDLPVDVMVGISKAEDALTREHGEEGFNKIHRRSIQMVAEVVGGELAPPVAQWPADGLVAVETDILAERIVKEAKRSGLRPSRDPSWREQVNRRWTSMIDRAIKSLDTPKPQPVPQQTIEALVEATVTRQIAERGLVTRDSLPGRDFYRGVFEADTKYRTGDAVTYDGSMWFARRDTTSRPGTDDSWTLAVKKGRDGRRDKPAHSGAAA